MRAIRKRVAAVRVEENVEVHLDSRVVVHIGAEALVSVWRMAMMIENSQRARLRHCAQRFTWLFFLRDAKKSRLY